MFNQCAVLETNNKMFLKRNRFTKIDLFLVGLLDETLLKVLIRTFTSEETTSFAIVLA